MSPILCRITKQITKYTQNLDLLSKNTHDYVFSPFSQAPALLKKPQWNANESPTQAARSGGACCSLRSLNNYLSSSAFPHLKLGTLPVMIVVRPAAESYFPLINYDPLAWHCRKHCLFKEKSWKKKTFVVSSFPDEKHEWILNEHSRKNDVMLLAGLVNPK